MRRKRRSKTILGNGVGTECKMVNYWDSEEEADSDNSRLAPNSLASSQNLGRRATNARNGDLEQGKS